MSDKKEGLCLVLITHHSSLITRRNDVEGELQLVLDLERAARDGDGLYLVVGLPQRELALRAQAVVGGLDLRLNPQVAARDAVHRQIADDAYAVAPAREAARGDARALEDYLGVAPRLQHLLAHHLLNLAAVFLLDVVGHGERVGVDLNAELRRFERVGRAHGLAPEVAYGDDGVVAERGEEPLGESLHGETALACVQSVESHYLAQARERQSTQGRIRNSSARGRA